MKLINTLAIGLAVTAGQSLAVNTLTGDMADWRASGVFPFGGAPYTAGSTFSGIVPFGHPDDVTGPHDFTLDYEVVSGQSTWGAVTANANITNPALSNFFGTVANDQLLFASNGVSSFETSFSWANPIEDFYFIVSDIGGPETLTIGATDPFGAPVDLNTWGYNRVDFQAPVNASDGLAWNPNTGFLDGNPLPESNFVDGAIFYIPGPISQIDLFATKDYGPGGGFQVGLFKQVPEPSRALLLLGGMMTMLLRRSR